MVFYCFILVYNEAHTHTWRLFDSVSVAGTHSVRKCWKISLQYRIRFRNCVLHNWICNEISRKIVFFPVHHLPSWNFITIYHIEHKWVDDFRRKSHLLARANQCVTSDRILLMLVRHEIVGPFFIAVRSVRKIVCLLLRLFSFKRN